jgi:hypothetical protein
MNGKLDFFQRRPADNSVNPLCQVRFREGGEAEAKYNHKQ